MDGNERDRGTSVVERISGKFANMSDHFVFKVLVRPALVVFLTIVLPLILAVVTGFGYNIPSTIYLSFKPVANAELREFISLIVDATTVVIFPAAVLLITASTSLHSLIKWQKRRETELHAKIDTFMEQSREMIRASFQVGMDSIQTGADKNNAHVNGLIDAMVSGWSQVLRDEDMRVQLQKLTNNINASPLARKNNHRVILRVLVNGMVERLSKLMRSIETQGSYMDPEERKELTAKIFKETDSYHVLIRGIDSPTEGPWRWHTHYLDFLERASRESGKDVSWTFVLADRPTQHHLNTVAANVRGLGIKCYIYSRTEKGDTAWDNVDKFLEHGCFIEIFGDRNPTPGKVDFHQFIWKATEVRKRDRRGMPAKFDITLAEDAAMVSDEGVWSTDELLKLIRIGVTQDGSESTHVLNAIFRDRKEVSAAALGAAEFRTVHP